jgi:hypothetical protein
MTISRPTSDDGLVDELREAIRRSIAIIEAAHSGERICGFALCTDDDLSTLYHVACTHEFCARHPDGHIAWVPVDWEYNEGAELFERSSLLLRTRGIRVDSEAAHHEHVETGFRDLTSALLVARLEDLVSDDTLLLVTSTDPGWMAEQLAVVATRRLNPDDVAARWQQAMGPQK